MINNILRSGTRFGDWFKHGAILPGIGWIEVYRDTGRVYLNVFERGSTEITGVMANVVKAILALEVLE
jgi:hypothetical protein